jgi:acyl carrier protein phosphodiesterase
MAAFDQKLVALGGATGGGRGGGRGAVAAGPDTLASVSSSLTQLMRLLESADVAPATQALAAAADRRAALAKLVERWNALKSRDLADLNTRLQQANLPALAAEAAAR